jgi:hypothetical protein
MIDLLHAGHHRSGLSSDKWVSRETGCSSEASFDFRAAFNATATRMMTVLLRNQQAGTEYS